MKPKKRKRRHAVKGGTTRLAPAVNEEGIIRPNTGNLRLPDALIEASDNKERTMMPGKVILTITALALIFIAIITWFVSEMPEK